MPQMARCFWLAKAREEWRDRKEKVRERGGQEAGVYLRVETRETSRGAASGCFPFPSSSPRRLSSACAARPGTPTCTLLTRGGRVAFGPASQRPAAGSRMCQVRRLRPSSLSPGSRAGTGEDGSFLAGGGYWLVPRDSWNVITEGDDGRGRPSHRGGRGRRWVCGGTARMDRAGSTCTRGRRRRVPLVATRFSAGLLATVRLFMFSECRRLHEQPVRLADGWCWSFLREKYCWLVADG
jgi:hypothetical protein